MKKVSLLAAVAVLAAGGLASAATFNFRPADVIGALPTDTFKSGTKLSYIEEGISLDLTATATPTSYLAGGAGGLTVTDQFITAPNTFSVIGITDSKIDTNEYLWMTFSPPVLVDTAQTIKVVASAPDLKFVDKTGATVVATGHHVGTGSVYSYDLTYTGGVLGVTANTGSFSLDSLSVEPAAVPLPSSLVGSSVLGGVLALGYAARKRRAL